MSEEIVQQPIKNPLDPNPDNIINKLCQKIGTMAGNLEVSDEKLSKAYEYAGSLEQKIDELKARIEKLEAEKADKSEEASEPKAKNPGK